MTEFGSDFHQCAITISNNHWFDLLGDVRTYSCGRHAIDAILADRGWKRIWVPAYFCYEVIGHIQERGIEVVFYDDNPLREDDDKVVRSLPFQDGDVLLRINYFGLRAKRSNKGLSVPVIEDHSHDLFSDWAIQSDADWCIASIRKSLPVAAGGILWSPKKYSLPEEIKSTTSCEEMAAMRYGAMTMKSDYLNLGGDKEIFRKKFVETEEWISNLSLSGMDKETLRLAQTFEVNQWTLQRCQNWYHAERLLRDNFYVLCPEQESCQPFSIILLCKTAVERMTLRSHLIKNCIYPAILWNIPKDAQYNQTRDFSERMLSIHCDGRYHQDDIHRMCNLINKFYDSDI